MKISDKLVLVNKKDGSWYIRRMRRDRTEDKMSPARREILQLFRQKMYESFNKTGYDNYPYTGRLLNQPALNVGLGLKGYKARSEHINDKLLAQRAVQKELNKVKPTFISWLKRIIYVLK